MNNNTTYKTCFAVGLLAFFLFFQDSKVTQDGWTQNNKENGLVADLFRRVATESGTIKYEAGSKKE